jgi:protein SCO1/2
MTVRTLILVVGIASFGHEIAYGQTGLPKDLGGVDFEQKLDAQLPLDLRFTDEAGRAVMLHEFFDDKPVILVLAYFRCPMLCDRVLNGLTRAMLDMPFTVGKEFRVLTVSFDPSETAEMARVKKQTYLDRYGRPGASDGWRFLTGEADAIERLTDAVGFRFRYDEKHQQFSHAAGIVLLTPHGKVSRYFFDVRYSPSDLRLGLVEASENRVGSAADRVLLFCFHYDPETGRYGPAVMNIVRAGGALTIVSVGLFAAALWRRERRHHNQRLVGETP